MKIVKNEWVRIIIYILDNIGFKITFPSEFTQSVEKYLYLLNPAPVDPER